METSEQIEILERFRRSDDWSYLKNEITEVQKIYEGFKDQAIVQGDSAKAARMLGIIQGLGIASNLPETVLSRKLKPGFMKKAQEVIDESVASVQTLLNKAFKDFPAPSGREK